MDFVDLVEVAHFPLDDFYQDDGFGDRVSSGFYDELLVICFLKDSEGVTPVPVDLSLRGDSDFVFSCWLCIFALLIKCFHSNNDNLKDCIKIY